MIFAIGTCFIDSVGFTKIQLIHPSRHDIIHSPLRFPVDFVRIPLKRLMGKPQRHIAFKMLCCDSNWLVYDKGTADGRGRVRWKRVWRRIA